MGRTEPSTKPRVTLGLTRYVWALAAAWTAIVVVLGVRGAYQEREYAQDPIRAEVRAHIMERTPDLGLLWLIGLIGLAMGAWSLRRRVRERDSAEVALHHEHNLLRTIIDTIPHDTYIKDREGRFLLVNRNIFEYRGLDGPKPMLGRSDADFCPADEARRLSEEEERIMATGEPILNRETQTTALDGTPRWYLITKVPTRDARGNINGLVGINWEISKIKRAELARQETEQRFRTVFDAARDSIFIKDRDLKYVQVNRAMEDLFGRPASELIGRTDAELFGEAADAHIQAVDERVLAGETIDEEDTKPVGEALHTFHTIKTPIRDDTGAIVGLCGIARDVTERKRDEEELAFRAMLLDNISDQVTATDLEGRITYVNRAECESVGKSREEIIGQFTETYGEDLEAGATQKEIVRQTRENGSWRGEVVNYTASGRRIVVDCRTWLLRDETGRPSGLCGIARDITERKRAEEERLYLERKMQHAQKLESLGVLAGGIAHDFNNILMAILGNADLALQEISPMSPARDNLRDIEKAAQRAAGLAKQMLAYSGKGRFVIEPIRINELVEEMIHILDVSISKKVVLKYRFADNPPVFDGDATQIRQVVMNLITNASEAIGERSGVIALSTGAMECDCAYLDTTDEATRSVMDTPLPEGVYVFLEVADTGCGMNAETQTKLFDPFFSTKFTGRGLGMAAVQGIVRGHKGVIKVYSEPGKGSTFKILFPANEEAPPPPSQLRDRTTAAIPDSAPKTGTILIADDEASVRTLGKKMIEREGFSVLTAVNGRETVDVFREHADKIVCVLLDLTMPHLDSEQVFTELRRIRPDARVVLTSGYNEQDATQRFAGKGLAGFIQKPYKSAALIAKLRKAIEG